MKKFYIIYIMSSLAVASLNAQDGLGTYLRNVIQNQEKGILVMARLIDACGLCDSLDLLMDNQYEQLYQTGQIPSSINIYDGYSQFYTPEHRRYGYTLFAETDEFWENALGKNYKNITVANVAAYIWLHCQFAKDYRNDKNYSKPENLIFQFVTYHLLNRQLSADCLVNHVNERGYNPNKQQPGVPVCEYYTTMGDRRLLCVYESRESNGICLNRFPTLDNGRRGTYEELSCDPDKMGIPVDMEKAILGEIPNAAVYPIGKLVVFDNETAKNMGSIRLRMDVASFFPEMATNGIRLSPSLDECHKNVYLPNDIYPYLDDLTVNNSETHFCYWTGRGDGWQNMQGDEIACMGRQDITLRLPPVPKSGKYELRMATQSGSPNRGTIQAYFGTQKDNLSPLGMPMDLRQGTEYLRTTSGNIPSYIGYETDTDDDYYNQMRDNELHENNYMKGCNQYCAGSAGTSPTMRGSQICLRRILGRVTMDPDKTYYLRLKSVLDRSDTQLYMDYLEFCPESVYDNPNKPEDIW